MWASSNAITLTKSGPSDSDVECGMSDVGRTEEESSSSLPPSDFAHPPLKKTPESAGIVMPLVRWCENPFSHPNSRESLPAFRHTG